QHRLVTEEDLGAPTGGALLRRPPVHVADRRDLDVGTVGQGIEVRPRPFAGPVKCNNPGHDFAFRQDVARDKMNTGRPPRKCMPWEAGKVCSTPEGVRNEVPMADQPSQAMQDYLKAIHSLGGAEAMVSPVVIAARLGVRAPSVTGMLKRLAE